MDMADKLRVKNIIRTLYPDHSIYLNYFLWYSIAENRLKFALDLTESDVQDAEYLSRPDVLCWANWQAKKLTKPYVIEIDGAVHKGDHKREKRYKDLGVPAIIVNKADLDYLDTPWEQYIEAQIANLGYQD